MGVDINNSPDLTMEETTKQLFNNEFMSDIQFHVEGKVLFAHSWELMKRSIVFHEQFKENLGVNKLIPIENTTYKAFHEFLRFIYTDQFDTEESMRCEILKLAVRYKILKLENIIMNMVCGLENDLKYFEFGALIKSKLISHLSFYFVITQLNLVINLNSFFDIHSNAMEEILKSNEIPPKVTEVKLFDVLVRWMDRYCATNKMLLSQRRSFFDKLLRLIRFPLMTPEQFRLCTENHPDLLTPEDISTICQQIILRPQDKNQKWNANPRLEYVDSVGVVSSDITNQFSTKFTVSNDLILIGLRYGYASNNCEILISAKNRTTGVKEVFRFKFLEHGKFGYMNLFSLGESIKLKPDVDYTIDSKYLNHSQVCCRKSNIKCIVTGPELITLTDVGDNLFEIFVKSPND